jgi:hypothetical protein
MRRDSLIRTVLAALCLLLACSNSGESPAPPATSSSYLPGDSPDQLMANFALSWSRMDSAAYAGRVLYDGVLPAADRKTYEPFRFYFAGEGGASYGLADELTTAGKMLSGRSQNGAAVARITMEIQKVEDWTALPQPGDAWGDPYPAGTMRAVYGTRTYIELKDTIPGTTIDHFDAHEPRLAFYAIPVSEGSETNWRLWKQHDLGEE